MILEAARMVNRMKIYDFAPDYRNIVLAASNQAAPRLPLYEHVIGGGVMTDVLGWNPYDQMNSDDPSVREQGFAGYWDFWRRMGYDTASFE